MTGNYPSNAPLASMEVMGGASSGPWVSMNGNSLSENTLTFGTNGSFVQSGGTHSVLGTLTLGGSYSLSGSGKLSGSQETIAGSGSTPNGVFQQIGGTHEAGTLTIGKSGSGNGFYSLSGTGILTAGTEFLGGGSGGRGAFVQSGGTHTITSLTIGSAGGGSYTMSGSSVLSATSAVIGSSGTGSQFQSGGSASFGTLTLGLRGDGAYTLSNSGLLTTTKLILGEFATSSSATGNFLHSSGTHTNTESVTVGNGKVGTYTMSGGLLTTPKISVTTSSFFAMSGTARISASNETVSGASTGATFVQSAGTNSVSGTISLGGDGTSGRYSLSGSGVVSAARVNLGTANLGGGLWSQTGGSANVTGTGAGEGINIGTGTSSGILVPSGIVNLSGGTLATTSASIGGTKETGGARGTLSMSGGTMTVSGGLKVWNDAANRVLVSGGRLGAGSTSNEQVIQQTGGTMLLGAVSGGGTLDVSGGTASVSSVRQGTLSVGGSGRLVVNANGGASGVSYLSSLSVSGSGVLDLMDNGFVVNSGSYQQISDLRWKGYRTQLDSAATGIVSSVGQTLAGNPILAVFDNSVAHFAEWPFGSGNTVANAAVVGAFACLGDADLNGMVTPDDYGAVDSHLGQHVGTWDETGGMSWFSGDWNLDGEITPDDYGAVDSNLGYGEGNPLTATGMSAMGTAAVPEPSLVGIVVGVGAMTRRRRGKTRAECPTTPDERSRHLVRVHLG
ncbi:MAG TPA: hypothetical protein VF669_13540 [Tepidisphaeraceae bacterium]|jgi:hypothetical protein